MKKLKKEKLIERKQDWIMGLKDDIEIICNRYKLDGKNIYEYDCLEMQYFTRMCPTIKEISSKKYRKQLLEKIDLSLKTNFEYLLQSSSSK